MLPTIEPNIIESVIFYDTRTPLATNLKINGLTNYAAVPKLTGNLNCRIKSVYGTRELRWKRIW